MVAPSRTEEIHAGELPSLASLAAVEIDDLIMGRQGELDAVTKLARALSSSVHTEGSSRPALQLDPTRVLVIKRAFDDLSVIGPPAPSTLDGLIQSTVEVTKSLEQLGPGHSLDIARLKHLRKFCLALSRRASALVYGGDEMDERHPFRR